MDYPGLISGLVRALALALHVRPSGGSSRALQQLRGLARDALGHRWQSQGPQVACWWQLEGLRVRSGPAGPQPSGRSRLAAGCRSPAPGDAVSAAGWRVMQRKGSEYRCALPLLT